MSDYDTLFPRQLRLLFYDIETAPMLAYIWQLKTEYVPPAMVEHDTFLLCWSAKWSDSDKVLSGKLTRKEALGQDDSRIVTGLADLLRQADYAVAHNGDRFDLPMVNNRMLALDLPPVGNVQTIDTLKLARQSFRLASNKLDYLARLLGHGGKLPTGFDLWRRAYHGDTKALAELLTYNKHDVVLLERVFQALIPHVKTLPRLVEMVEWRMEACPTCGSKNRVKDGYHRTKVSTFQRYRCKQCGRRHRDWQSIGSHRSGTIGL